MKNHLIEVRPNTFLNMYDSNFVSKYLRFNPKDDAMVYTYAKKMLASGKTDLANAAFKQAAEMGNTRAKAYLANQEILAAKKEAAAASMLTPAAVATRSAMPAWFGYTLATLGALALFFIFMFVGMKLVDEWQRGHVEKTTHVVVEEAVAPDTTAVQNALSAYKEKNGTYPSELMALVDDGYLKALPGGISYRKTDKGYTLDAKGTSATEAVASSPVSLVLYPGTAELAVERGGEVLATYPVAYGETTGDANGSSVIKRVVNPNGGDGIFGTRGLELADNIAIHGTNDPSSIGLVVTKGCIRMNNADIEELYDYVPMGTAFTIADSSDAPGDETYPGGLPKKDVSMEELSKEKTPNVTYHWRQ
jgi:lipoprotein-anchoring transpeptidase ErfK/SrfK